MLGIPRRLAEQSLNILKGFKPVKQALRRFSEPKRQAMGEELAKLLGDSSEISNIRTG